MATNKNAEEAPLGFAGDVDGSTSFRLAATPSAQSRAGSSSSSPVSEQHNINSSSSSSAPVQVERLPPPSLQDRGLVGGGVVLAGMEAGRSVLVWRAQESGLWLEERGLDDDLEGGGLHLKLQGGVSTRDAVGIFGGEGGAVNQSAVAVCARTDDGVIHRVLLHRQAAPPGEKAPSALGAMMSPQAREVVRLGCKEGGHGPCCWINRDLLVVGGADGSLHCVRIVDGVEGQAASLSEETLRAKSGWNPLSGGGGGGSKVVAITGFWQEEEKQATVLTLHTDWSFRVWTTTRLGARRGGALVHRVDARQFLGPSHRNQTAAVDGSGCFLSAVVGQEGYVVAAVAAEGGLPIHMALFLPPSGGEPDKRGMFEAPGDAGPLVDAYVDDNLTIWTLWARPRGGGGGRARAAGATGRGGGGGGRGFGCVCSYGNASLAAIHHHTIDEWLGAQEEEDGVFDDLFQTKGGWAGLVSLRCPPNPVAGEGAGGGRAVAFAAVELMESFYLRRMFAAGRFGRRALASAIREALPRLSDARPLSSNSTSREDLQDLALEGVRNAAEQAFRTLDEEQDSDGLAMSETWQQALRDVHALWKRLLEACVGWGRAEARPLGLAPGGAEEFANPFVIRAGRTACLMPRGGAGGSAACVLSPSSAATGRRRGDGGRVSRLREIAAEVPAAFEEALLSGAGGGTRAGAGAAMFRGFDVESALAREGTAGGLEDADNFSRGLGEEGGYKREQEAFLRQVSDSLLRSAAGVRLAEAAAGVLQTDAVRDVLTWVESLKPVKEKAQSRPLGHRGGVRGASSGIATASAFGAVKILRNRSAEARNTAVVLLLVLDQIDRVGLAEQLQPNIVGDALPLALKCINQYALAAEVGSHHLRVRSGGGRPSAASSLGRGVGRGGLGGVGGSAQPAAVAALKPWGCTALEGLFLDGRGVVQDYWAMVAESNSERRRVLGLGGLPALLAGMCEGTLRSPLDGLDSGGLVAFLHASEQYQLALPLVGLAVEWQWRMKVGEKKKRRWQPETAVLTAIARGFLYSAEAVARSGGAGDSSAAGPLLDRATKWYLKASQALRASLLRRGSSPRSGGGGGGAEAVVKHFEDALQEVGRVRDRVKSGTGGAVGLGSGGDGEEGGDFGGRGAVNALELARAALDTERRLRSSPSRGSNSASGMGRGMALEEQVALQRQARLCRLVFKHASEALSFEEAFGAVCDNPIDRDREENLKALAQHMCESGRLGELCRLPLSQCPPFSLTVSGEYCQPVRVVEGALWGLARDSNVADLAGGAGRRRWRRKANYYDCLYALYMATGAAVEAARAQDELRERWVVVVVASTLLFAAAAQRARLAALNALAVAPLAADNNNTPPFSSSEAAAAAVASICPPVEERRLDAAGRPAGVRTAAVLGREAAAAAAAIGGWAGVPGRFAAAAGAKVALVARTGVSGVVEALTSAGRFEEAADVVLKGLDHQPRAMVDEMNKVVSALTRSCVLAEDIAKGYEPGPIPPLVRGVGPLKPRVPTAAAAAAATARTATLGTESAECAASLWPVLRQLLRLDSADNSFSYHATAAKVLLEGMPASPLPPWLEESYLGRGQEFPDPPANANAFPPPQPRALLAPWKVFTPGSEGDGARRSDPAALLDMYVFDGRLEEACLFLSRLLDVGEVDDIGAITRLVPEESGGTDFLPYASIDRLFALCESSLERSVAAAKAGRGGGVAAAAAAADIADGLSHAFETVQERLAQYFKIAKATSDQAQSNRAAAATEAATRAAAAAAVTGGGYSSTSAFMLTD
ncbi:unnamed protein product [Pylaiella littoralis]